MMFLRVWAALLGALMGWHWEGAGCPPAQGFEDNAALLGRLCGVRRHLACPCLLMYGRLLAQDAVGLAVSPGFLVCQ